MNAIVFQMHSVLRKGGKKKILPKNRKGKKKHWKKVIQKIRGKKIPPKKPTIKIDYAEKQK